MATFYFRDRAAPRPQRTRIGDVAVIMQDQRVLLERRADSGQWGLVGGGLEVTETLEECLIREVLEETGLVVIQASLLGVFSDPSRIASYPDGNVVRIVSAAYWVAVSGAMRPSVESLALEYHSVERIGTLPIVPTHVDILETVQVAVATEAGGRIP